MKEKNKLQMMVLLIQSSRNVVFEDNIDYLSKYRSYVFLLTRHSHVI
jgi:hypothetical protein